MSKYNPRNIQHRSWLARNVLNLLQKWGFQIPTDGSYDKTWEFVLERTNKYDSNKAIIIYTSIDKQSGAMRQCGDDRIRVIFRDQNTDLEGYHTRVARINRVGEFKKIQQRLVEGIKAAQRL